MHSQALEPNVIRGQSKHIKKTKLFINANER